jgi:hypothetical protein
MDSKPTMIKVGWKDIRIEYIDSTFKKNNADFWGQFISRKGLTNHLMAVFKDNPWLLDWLKQQIQSKNPTPIQKSLI